MRLRLLVTSIVTAAAFTAMAWGQARGTGFSHPPVVNPGFSGFGTTTTGFNTKFPRRPFSGSPIVFYSDLGYEPIYPQPVSVVVVQPPAPAATPVAEPVHVPAKPLLLELQGDRWVQLEHFQMSGAAARYPSKTELQQNRPTETLLIFRDGRAESTGGYAVIGDALYEQTNYWSSGSWTKKIPLADLDLAATTKANQERGVVFKLPGGPNEVVLQP